MTLTWDVNIGSAENKFSPSATLPSLWSQSSSSSSSHVLKTETTSSEESNPNLQSWLRKAPRAPLQRQAGKAGWEACMAV
uniref:Uncharacterized protein n=1 Tax=Physcomitrium patens TaxID=3218 RepID=A0A2K1IUN7_PHYPA|nr:hypothetical protein PHYPA_024936 [Physcomitrium patens]